MFNSESSDFQINQLDYFSYLFSDEERDALKRWGAQATRLSEGSVLPTSDKETNFVEVTKGKAPPLTRFQRLWLRYLQAIDIQTKWRESERKLIATISLLSEANCKIELLQEDVIRLTKLWKFARDSVRTPITGTENNKKLLDQSSTTNKCGSATLVQIFARDLIDRDQYLKFIEKGLINLSDNEIFVLFNLVDALGLTPQEVAEFNIEHNNRSRKYHSVDSVSHADWDWRDQNEAK